MRAETPRETHATYEEVSGKMRTDIMTEGQPDSREGAEQEAVEWGALYPNVAYTVHAIGPALAPEGTGGTDGE